jgi:hypothetical protein
VVNVAALATGRQDDLDELIGKVLTDSCNTYTEDYAKVLGV